MDAKTLQSIQILAIKAIEEPTYHDFYEKVCRWYSQKFHTPLHTIDEIINEQDLLRIYFEERYRDLMEGDASDQKIYGEVRQLAMDTFTGTATANESSDDDWAEELEKQAAEDAKKFVPAKKDLPKRDPLLTKEDSFPNLLPESGSIVVNDPLPET